MTLKNLLGITLDEIKADKEQIGKLLAAAVRNIADAQLDGLSPETRFDVAYKAIMQLGHGVLQRERLPHIDQQAGSPPDCHPDLAANGGRASGRGDRIGRVAQATQRLGLFRRPRF
jgi:hypothetical protein